MGAADFLCIADHFHTVILADIPRMGPDSQDKAARFVTMIDSFYERKVKFICSAAARRTSSTPKATAPSSSSAPCRA